MIAFSRLLLSQLLQPLPSRYRDLVYRLIGLIIPRPRDVLAARYLRGSGVEIGAMHNPLRLQRGVLVQYVDYLSREENLLRFPELKGLNLVQPSFLEDGFSLPSFANASTDFLVANHVLEHTNNVLKTLERWAEILRKKGKLFISVPLADRCFDKGRVITQVDHFVMDYETARSGDIASFRSNTRAHYAEWLSISLPKIIASGEDCSSKRIAELAKTADELLKEDAEIHFHTFSMQSFEDLLYYFCTRMRHDFTLLEVVENGIEVIGVLEKQ